MDQLHISGPHVQLATFCDMVVEDKSGALCVIRMIDRITVRGPTPEYQPAQISPTLAISLKADFMRQKARVRVQPVAPNNSEMGAFEMPVLFEGDERGVQIVLALQLNLPEEGLYWFNVFVDDQMVTRVPLRLIYQQVASVAIPGPGGAG